MRTIRRGSRVGQLQKVIWRTGIEPKAGVINCTTNAHFDDGGGNATGASEFGRRVTSNGANGKWRPVKYVSSSLITRVKVVKALALR